MHNNAKSKTFVSGCVHLGCKKQQFCRHGAIIYRRTCFALHFGRCVAVTRERHRLVVCARNRRRSRKCLSGCRGRLLTEETRRVGCSCRRFRAVKRELCCCPKPRRTKFCRGGHFIVHKVKHFVLNSKRTACHAVTRASVKAVGKRGTMNRSHSEG